MDALRFAAPRLPAGVDAVRRLVWGGRGGRAPTELALEELVAQGRATRTDGGRYRPSREGSTGTAHPSTAVQGLNSCNFETLADVAAKWADPESVVAAARELRPRLEAARERLRQRLSERMAVVTADRELLVELDGYSQALGGGDS